MFSDMQSNLTNPHALVAEYTVRSDYFAMATEHVHPHYEMYILLSGERTYFIRDQIYEVRTGDIVFIGKNELHRTLPGELPDHKRIVVYFNDRFVEQHFGEHEQWLLQPFQRDYPVFHTAVRDQALIQPVIQQLVRELTMQAEGYELLIHHLVMELLIHCARSQTAASAEPMARRTAMQQQMSDIAQYIKQNHQQPLSLQGIADQFHLSPSHLSRMFKRTTGFHLTEYMNTVRIQTAQQLLRESGLKIIDIAEASGFGNFSHFGKIFKQMCQVSPREYRTAVRKGSQLSAHQ
ncbi:helix-turn-helix transcriptional regulator [Paenibacillus wulumuqiensis]|uniref:helix-turn-helix transcriptional regulator n=1 Tax=Paenibacillus wulumuqiensis TaxID=1567107 RepID=UPI0006197207|nr:helix-turn-helix domain-containing protein [Paenibacillus wulumuqiensis]